MATPEEYAAAVKRFKDQNWQNGGTTVTPTTGAQNLAAVGAQSGVDPNKGAQYKAAVEGFKAANWQNGGTTVTPTTGAQNLANVFNQQGNTSPITPYIQSQLDQAKIDTANQSQGGGGVATAAGAAGQGGSQPTDSGLGNAQDYINQLNDLRKNSALSALQKSHDTALSNMGAEKSAIQPKYYDARNATAAGAQQQARNFAEYMAQRGGSAGTAGQATLSNNLTTQGNLSNLGRQEAAAYTDIARRTSDLNNSYQSDIASTTANAEADKMSALLDNYYKAQQRGDTQAQNAIQNAMQQAQLTGQYQGNQTLAAQGQQFNQNLALTEQQQNAANTKFSQQMQIDGVAYQKARDAIGDKNYQATFENNIKQQGFENALKIAVQQHQISNDNAQIAISRQNANTNAYQAQTSRIGANNATNSKDLDNLYRQWDSTGVAPAGIPGVQQGTPLYDKTAARQDQQQQDKEGKLTIKAYETERDGMLNAVRTGKTPLPDAMAQINQDEQLGIYTADLAERLRGNLRVLSGNQPIQGDTTKSQDIKIDTSKMNFNTPSVTGNVFGR